MKTVIQLNDDGYVIGHSIADESPLEPGTYLIPRNCVDANLPNIPDGKNAKWTGSEFILEDIPVIVEDTIETTILTSEQKRAIEYPNIVDQLDMIYWDKINGTSNWVNSIQSIKDKFPKE
jgi:hypothetical protein